MPIAARQKLLTAILVGACALAAAQGAQADAPPTPVPDNAMVPLWMTPPAGGPRQEDAGALVYYYHCMACHGDEGQGLTVEWRAQWDPEHQNCARSGCHGSRPPPEGFTFPRNFAPAIMGANTLTRFENAAALFAFVSQKMPYQAPGSLTRKEYWDLVAFLLSRRGVQVEHLDASNAQAVPLNPPDLPLPALAGAVGVLALAGVVGGWLAQRARAKTP